MKKIGRILAEGGGSDVYEENGKYFLLVYPVAFDSDKCEKTTSSSTKAVRQFDSLIDLLKSLPGQLGFCRESDEDFPPQIEQLLREGRDWL